MWNFSVDAIESQLERILASPEFVNGPKLGHFLRYVVGQTLNGHSDKIKQYSIAVEGLGYGREFDPTNNTTVRLLAGRLRRALKSYYDNHGSADPIRIDIPKGSYVPVFVENDKATVASNRPVHTPTVSAQAPGEISEPVIAVSEFQNLNDPRKYDHITRGLTAEFLASLTNFAGLSVVGPMVAAENHSFDFDKLFHKQGVVFVLQGWIRRNGSIVRITTNLLEASTESNRWTQTFEFDLKKTSLFDIEDEVTSQVTGAIADSLGIIFRKLQSESYYDYIKLNDVTNAVLTYNNFWTTEAPQDCEKAISAIDRALASDPDNALLVALQSNTYYGDVIHEFNLVPDALSKMEPLALKAVSLDPNLQIAQYNLVVQHGFRGRAKQCVEAARKVVAMNPNHARILAGCAVQVASVGAYELGLELIERARRLNPQFPSWYFFVDYLVDFHNAEYEQAWVNAQLIHVEGTLWHPLLRAAVLGKLGRIDEAKPHTDELLQIKPNFPQKPREYLTRLFVIDEHIDMIWDGLLKAGIQD